MSTKKEAVQELQHQMLLLREIHDECAGIIEEHFPEEVSYCRAYEILDFGWSSNPYNRTFQSLIADIEMRMEEES
jgi:hypothetical protein